VNGTDSGNGHPCTPLTLPPNKTTAKIGGTLTLLGSQTGEQMDVTVLKIIDPLPGHAPIDPRPGTRRVGVTFVMLNSGGDTYKDSPGNGATLILSDNSQVDRASLGPVGCNEPSLSIATGASRRGCLAFEVPTGLSVKTVQLTLDSGFADKPGEWTVR
jgi:hypothetical protein